MQTEEQQWGKGKKIRALGKYQMLKRTYSPLEGTSGGKKKVTGGSQVTTAKNSPELMADTNIEGPETDSNKS